MFLLGGYDCLVRDRETLPMRYLIFLLVIFSSQVKASPVERSQEDLVFDRYAEKPDDLLLSLYEESDILILAESNHENGRVYDQLLRLLKKVADDPRLEFVLLERFHDVSSVFQDASVNDLVDVLDHGHFSSAFSQNATLCGGRPWAYTFAEFLPEVQKINKARKAKPILVSSFDSIPSFRDLLWPNSTNVDMSACRIQDQQLQFTSSENREEQTASIFMEKFFKHHKPGKKMIIMYHYMHALRHLQGCLPKMIDAEHWKTVWTDATWFGKLLSADPSVVDRSRIVLFDEKDSGWNQSGVLSFTQHQANRYPGRDFSIKTRFLDGVVKESGLDLFLEDSYLKRYHGGNFYSDAKIHQLVDGIIWTSDASDRYPLKKPAQYLPDLCGAGSPTSETFWMH